MALSAGVHHITTPGMLERIRKSRVWWTDQRLPPTEHVSMSGDLRCGHQATGATCLNRGSYGIGETTGSWRESSHGDCWSKADKGTCLETGRRSERSLLICQVAFSPDDSCDLFLQQSKCPLVARDAVQLTFICFTDG